MLPEALQHLDDMALVCRRILRINEDIIQVHNASKVHEACQRSVDVGLEGRWRVYKAKRHNEVLKVPILCPKRRLPLVAFAYTDPMVRIAKVQLGETPSSGQPIQDFAHQRQRIPVLDCEPVQPPIVDAEAQFAILLGCKENWCARRTRRFADPSAIQAILYVFS